jgi:hypothetical protein
MVIRIVYEYDVKLKITLKKCKNQDLEGFDGLGGNGTNMLLHQSLYQVVISLDQIRRRKSI